MYLINHEDEDRTKEGPDTQQQTPDILGKTRGLFLPRNSKHVQNTDGLNAAQVFFFITVQR